jgi:hypothetical protein
MKQTIFFSFLLVITLNCCTQQSNDNSKREQTDTAQMSSIDTIQKPIIDTVQTINNIQISNESVKPSGIGKHGVGLTLIEDSGYILKKNGLRFLVSVGIANTANSFWSNVKSNDTIGKYYYVKRSNSFYICLIDLSSFYPFVTHLLLEVDTMGKILKQESFLHGNNPCCWDNDFEGFNKYGDYFGLKTCGSGSGYCSSYLYLFKEIIPQDKQLQIPISYWTNMCPDGLEESLNSSFNLRNDSLHLDFIFKRGSYDRNSNFKVIKSSKFEMLYIFNGNKWRTNDKSKLKNMFI